MVFLQIDDKNYLVSSFFGMISLHFRLRKSCLNKKIIIKCCRPEWWNPRRASPSSYATDKAGSFRFTCLWVFNPGMWIVEATEYFLLPLPAPYQVNRFQVCFQLLSSKCFRFRLLKKSNASKFVSASCFFLQSASASKKI